MGFDSREHLMNLRRGKSVTPKSVAEYLEHNDSTNAELGKAATEVIRHGHSMIIVDEWGSVTHKKT